MAGRPGKSTNGNGKHEPEPTEEPDRSVEAVGGEEPPFLPFTVVGVGASAGGLEALTEFFNAVRSDTGMAFVVVQHLPPQRESLMADILSKHTAMPVRQVEDGMAVEANHVYVIRPGNTMTVGQGLLHLGEPLEKRGHQRPVDDFFRSLAREQRERAVCVVLSGMGSNGTAGAQMVKAAGGVCVAQDPESAKFPSMPRSLIDAGLTDYVLRPAEMPEVLARYAEHPYAKTGGRSVEATAGRESKLLGEVVAVLRTRTRHGFNGYKRPTLVRRIQRRMGLAHLSSLSDYVRLLRQTPAEAAQLADDLLIHVTGFFRDPDAWEALRKDVIVPLVARRGSGESIRCWVTACSSGEEAYTLAMLLVEEADRAEKRFDVKIFATDMAERSLSHARAGIYPNGIEGEVTAERLARFFDKDDGSYRVRRDLRELLVFAPQNVLEDPPFSRMDICCCRNLLIYLEPETQRKLLHLLHFGLTEGGTLMLGTSETAGEAEGLFEATDKKARLFRRVGPTRHGVLDFPTTPTQLLSANPNAAGREATRGRSATLSLSVAQLTQRALADLYTPASVVVDPDLHVVYFHGRTDAYLQQPQGEPTRDLMALVRESLRGAVRSVVQAAVQAAGDRDRPDRGGAVQTTDGAQRTLVRAVPLDGTPGGRLTLVSFSQVPEPPHTPVTEGSEASLRSELGRVRDDLQTSVEALQATNEELKASNEEVTSVNEELQSTNEELETSKEELQSLNEELTTVNAQLQAKMDELLATTNDLSSLLSSTNIAVVFLDQQFRIRRFTPATRDLMDLIGSDVGRPLQDMARKFADPDLLADAAAVLERLVPIEREVSSESGRWYVRRALPYRTADDHISGVVLTFVDITQRRQAESDLQTSHERVRLAVEATHMGFWELEAATGADSFDLIHGRIMGLPHGQKNGPLTEVMARVHADDRDRLMAAVNQTLATHGDLAIEFRVVWPDGSVHHVAKFGRVLPATGTTGARLLGTSLDVTDRAASDDARERLLAREQGARHAAEAANEAKDQFLANVSHELRTPLSAILLWAKVLRNPTAADAQRREGMDAIARAAESQRELIEDLLDTSRISAGKLRLDVRAFDLGQTVRDAADNLRPAADARRVTLSVDVAADLGWVNADPDRLQQVLWNLLSNAVKFTPADGRVALLARRDGDEVTVTVTDTGRGLAAAQLPHVFERFWQAKGPARYAKVGLGLGLAIAKQLVELHGGTIEAASDGEGRGTTFTVRLPLPAREKAPRAAARPAAAGRPPRLGDVRLLLVEDDAATRDALAVLLRDAGAVVTAVGSVAEAWQAYAAGPPDLLLSDIGLPDGDGHDLIRRVRTAEADRKAATTPAVALTALVRRQDRRRSAESGFQQHLAKPVDPDQLIHALVGLLDR